MLCPGSMQNPPTDTDKGLPSLVTMTLKDSTTATVSVDPGTPTFVKILQSGSITWTEFSYLGVEVVANPFMPPSGQNSTSAASNSTPAASRRSSDGAENSQGREEEETAGPGGDSQLSTKASAKSLPKAMSGGLRFEDRLFHRTSEGMDRADSERRSASSKSLEWYFRKSYLPSFSTEHPAVFDYMAEGNSSITLTSPQMFDTYYLAFQAEEKYTASITAAQKSAVKLSEEQEFSFHVAEHEHTYMYYYPPSDGLVFLQVHINPALTNVASRIFVRLGALATERSWNKWVGGYDSQIDGMGDYSYTAVLFLKSDGDRYISWTFDPGMKSVWTVTPRLVAPTVLQLDTPFNFEIDPNVGARLFSVVPSDTNGNFYFQLMPSSAPSASTYQQWQTLQAATKIYAATKQNGQMTYFQVSDWGYTSDGTPGLQVMVDQWDAGATVYLLVFMENGAPSNQFSVVAFMAGSSFSSWKWWFGGVLFAVFVFCVGRCVLCRGPRGVSLFGGRSRNVRTMGTNTGVRGDVELQEVEEVCSSEPPPEILRKVNDTLYRRNDASSADANSVHVQVTVEAKDDPSRDQGGEQNGKVDESTNSAGQEGERAQQSNEKGENGEGEKDDGNGEDTSCIVCLDRGREAILLECGHGGLCLLCATSLWNQGPAGRHCPMCRKVFSGVMKIVEEQEDTVKVQAVHYAYKPPENSSGPMISILGIRDVLSSITGNIMNRSAASESSAGANNSSAIVLGLVTDHRRRQPYPAVQVRNEAPSGSGET